MQSVPKTNGTTQTNQFAQWGRRLKASDHAAFSELFQAMHTDLLRYAWRYTGSEEAARDIVQDVFLKLWQTRENLDPQRSIKALLYTMVRNLALNHNRAGQTHATPQTDVVEQWNDGDAVALDDQLDASMLSQQIHQWIAALPERRREAFMLSRFHGMSHDEIATIMNLTPRTVNTHIVLALRDLRARLGTLASDPTTL